jgi:hypothetical protein
VIAVLLALLSCEGPAPGDAPCRSAPPDGPFAQRVVCSDVLMGSDGRTSDFHLGNGVFTALVRHPTTSASAVGVGGGTVVDLAPWGGIDHLLEAIPLVDDGWMAIQSFELEEDGLALSGVVRSLPDRDATDVGASRSVTWRVDPTETLLRAEGADGLYLHVGGDTAWFVDSAAGLAILANDDTAYGVRLGERWTDLGGAVRVSGTELWVAPGADPWRGRGERRVAGSTEGLEHQATHIEIWSATAERLGRVPVVDGTYDFVLPPGAASVRAVAEGHAPGPLRAPDDPFIGTLEPGPPGSMVFAPSWLGAPPQHFRVTWTTPAPDGPQEHVWFSGPKGGTVPIGPEPVTITVSTRPDFPDLVYDVSPGDIWAPFWIPDFPVGERLLTAPEWPSARHRTWRGSNETALDLARSSGLDWVVMTPEDAVAPPLSEPPLFVRPGVRTTTHAGPPMTSWPYTNRVRQAGWGAPDPRDLQQADALADLRGAETFVTTGFLAGAPAPFLVDVWPKGVQLDRPLRTLENLQPWFDWLDAGVWLPPVGPRTWAEVDTLPPLVELGLADFEQPMFRGHSCATNGPLLILLDVDDTPSGEVVPPPEGVDTGVDRPEPVHEVRIRARAKGLYDRVVLIGAGGEVLEEWSEVAGELRTSVPTGRWWVAIGWRGDDWAVTAPVLGPVE